MAEGLSGFEHGLTNYGDRDFSLYLRRSFAQSMGYSRAMLGKPVIGIAYTGSGFNNCHRHFPELLEAVKRGVLAAGALPVEFPTISLGEVFLTPTSLKFRNLMSMDTEEMIRAQPMDAVVLMGGCDKTVPAQLMGAVSAGRPAMRLVGSHLPDAIVNAKSVENALRVLLALGGSTNAVIHLTAIAGRVGVKVTLDQINKLSDSTPVLVNLKPVGNGYMEDFFAAGGMGALLRELKPLLHLDCLTVTGETLGERLAADADANPYVDRTIIAAREQPFEPQGGLVALFGNIAPRGAILKRSAADAKLFEHEGRAVVFSSLADLAARIDDPKLDVAREDILVLQNAGPNAPEAMPEAGYLPIPKKLAQRGVKDMVRISDARMSGTAFGTIVLHVTPDAASGGPLGLVRNGDRIRLSVKARRIELLVDEADLKRRTASARLAHEQPTRGYAKLYAQEILGADEGCDFKFLRP